MLSRAGGTLGQSSPEGSPPQGMWPDAAGKERGRVQPDTSRTGRHYSRVATDRTQKWRPCPHAEGVTGGARPQPDGGGGEGGRRGRRGRGRRSSRGKPRRPVSGAPAERGGKRVRPSPMAEGEQGRRRRVVPGGPRQAEVEEGWPPCARRRRRRTRRRRRGGRPRSCGSRPRAEGAGPPWGPAMTAFSRAWSDEVCA